MIEQQFKLKPNRPYQAENLHKLLENVNQRKNTVLQQPTGTGKSNIILHQIKHHIQIGSKTLLITPRKQLVDDLSSMMGFYADVAYAGYEPCLHKPVLCCTSASALKYIQLYKPCQVVIDECHMYYEMQRKIKALFAGTITGYTATPNRLDGKGLNAIYSRLITSPKISWFVNQGYLSPYELHVNKQFDFEGLSDALDVQANLLTPHIDSIIDTWMEKARGTKTLIFVPSIEIANKLADLFTEKCGVNAIALTSKSSNQKEIFEAFRKGNIQVLINVELCTTGVDVPDVETVVMARFTFSTPLYLQMIGRGFRYVPNKVFKILDLVNNCFYHGSPSVDFEWSLAGNSIRAKGNTESLFYHCVACKEPIISISKIKGVQAYICPECYHENFFYPKSYIKKGSGSRLLETFTVSELSTLDNEQVTALTRILFAGKKKIIDKITMICRLEGVPKNLKIKALKHMNVSDKDISFYLD